MPSADRVPKASCRLVSDDQETQDGAKNASITQKGPESVRENASDIRGARVHAKNASIIRNEADPRESRRATPARGTTVGRSKAHRGTTDKKEDP